MRGGRGAKDGLSKAIAKALYRIIRIIPYIHTTNNFFLAASPAYRWVSERIPTPPGVQMVMFIPNFIGKTSDARNALGPNISRKEAAFNIGRVAYLVNGLNHGNLDCLKHGCEDALHQPQRGKAIYHYLYPMIEAAEAAGANACYLSGAGPTVMALTSGASGDIFTQHEKELNHVEVAKAMKRSAKESGIDGRVVVTNICNEGAKVVRVEVSEGRLERAKRQPSN